MNWFTGWFKVHHEWCCFCAAQVCFKSQNRLEHQNFCEFFSFSKWLDFNTKPTLFPELISPYIPAKNDYCQLWTEKPIHSHFTSCLCARHVCLNFFSLLLLSFIGLVSILTSNFFLFVSFWQLFLLFCFIAFLLKVVLRS